MDSNYSYIDIAVSCIDAAGSAAHHSFHGAPIISLPSLRDMATHFEDLTEGYLTWEVNGKRSFSYFELIPGQISPRTLVTLRMDSDVLMSGRQIVNILSSVKHRIADGEKITDTLLLRLVEDAGFPQEPRRCPWGSSDNDKATGVCCRIYATASELSNIFGFPRQSAYEPYKAVLVVAASVTRRPDSMLPVISEPLDKALLVVCPEGVTASAYRVDLSDRLRLNYTRSGFDPQEVDFEVGTTNRYVHISGPALVVNSADHAGIVFRKRIPFTIASTTGSAIDTYTILINERTANRNDEGFEITNLDFVGNNGVAKLTVQSTNYGSFEMEFTPESIAEEIPLAIELEPESRQVMLRLDFGDTRIFEVSLSVEKNTREYSGLRAGQFHGFRAHRLMGSSPETYNVDMRPLPEAPAAPVVADDAAHTEETPASAPAPVEQPRLPLDEPLDDNQHAAPVAPVIEKAPTAIWEHKKHQRHAPEFANETVDNGDDDGEKKSRAIDWKRYGAYALIAVAVVLIAIWIFGGSDSTSEEGVMAVEQTDAPASAAVTNASSPIASPSALGAGEEADIAYLNGTSDWHRGDMKSDMGRSLIDALAAGDIEAVTSNPYFATADRCTNNRALQIADMLWSAIGTPTARSNSRALTKLGITERVDLREVIKAIERYQPAEPNPSPRPGAPKAEPNKK